MAPKECEVIVKTVYKRFWLKGLAFRLARWRVLMNVVLWFMPIDAFVGNRHICRWRIYRLKAKGPTHGAC